VHRAALGERRLLLAKGTNPATVQAFEKKKLRVADDSARDVAGRIIDLERLIVAKRSEIGGRIDEVMRDLQEEIYQVQQREKMCLEKEILDAAGELIRQLVRHHRLSLSRGFDFQRFHSRMTNGDAVMVVEEYLGKLQPTAEADLVEAAAPS
jgi:hypothetical protein